MWKNGSTAITRSLSSMSRTGSNWQRFATRLRCVSMTPLGSPVVPLENGSATMWRAGSIAGLGAGVPGGAGDAMERDGVLRDVGRVDADDLARREPARGQPCRAAVHVLAQLRIGKHCAADGIDDRRPVASRGGVAEHEVGERDVRHVDVRVRAADGHRPGWTLRVGQMAHAASVIWPPCPAGAAMIRA